MRRIFFLSFVLAILGLGGASPAQITSAPPNVLMQLMQSQLPVDVSSPVVAKSEFNPPFATVGQKVVYRVTLNALEAAVRWPERMALPAGLQMNLTSRGQIMPVAEGMMRPQTALNFRVSAERPGFYTIPAITIEVYGKPVQVPEATLEIGLQADAEPEFARELILQPSRTNLYVGESLRLRVVLPGPASNLVESLSQLQFNGEGFAESKQMSNQHVEPWTQNGRTVQAWVIESSVTPLAAGSQKLTAQGFTSGMQMLGPIVLRGQMTFLGGQPRHLLLDSDPVTINVQPLPALGNIKGFTGFIGMVSAGPPQLSTNALQVGEVATLRVTFRSPDNLARFVPPPPPRVSGWQVFPATPAEVAAPGANNSLAFAYAMIPNSEEVRETPALPFSYFDPVKGAYVEATIPPVAVTVTAGNLPADWKPVDLGVDTPDREPELKLSELASTPGKSAASLVPVQLQGWFGWVQIAPAALFGALWYWDRRRRFLEAHPEVVRCRLARRALRRERRAFRQAASNGDAEGFVRRAVAALQIAAAPHFPAAPRALVCGEVLSLFNAAEQGGRTGEVVRQLFAREAAQAFAAKAEAGMPMFDLRPELENILMRMEARL